MQYNVRMTKWDSSMHTTKLCYQASIIHSRHSATNVHGSEWIPSNHLLASMGAGGCILCVYCTNSISRKIIWSTGWQMAQMLRKNWSQRTMNTFRTGSTQNWIIDFTNATVHTTDIHNCIQHASHALYICIPVQHVYTRFGQTNTSSQVSACKCELYIYRDRDDHGDGDCSLSTLFATYICFYHTMHKHRLGLTSHKMTNRKLTCLWLYGFRGL